MTLTTSRMPFKLFSWCSSKRHRGIRVEGSLGPWLYAVANRVAAGARANRRRIQAREISACVELAASLPDEAVDRRELAGVIHDEVGRLPEQLRSPLVLCYLQGMTHELAASQLGCPVGTVRSRLARARAQLLTRMTRRGLMMSATALVSALQSNARAAAIPTIERMKLIKLGSRTVSESAFKVGGLGVSASVITLLEGVLNVMRIKKLAVVAIGIVAMGALGLVIAQHPAVGGGTLTPQSGNQNSASVSRSVGPDSRPIGAKSHLDDDPTQPAANKIQTYYVGDLIGVLRPESRLPRRQRRLPHRPCNLLSI